LLSVTRNEVIEYLQKRSLKWRTDHTNADCTYTRNFVRHQLLPALQEDCSGFLVGQLSELADSARKLHSRVCNYAEKVWPEIAECSDSEIKLNLKMFLTQPPPVKVELVRRSLTAVGSGQREVTRQHFKRILNLARQKVTGRKIELPSGFVVQRDYDYIVFARPEKSSSPDELISKDMNVKIPGQTEFGQYVIEAAVLETDDWDIEKLKTEKTKYVERFDLEKLKLPLEARFRKAGDRFWPLGLDAEKKVGKFLTAAKVPQNLRRKLFVVADSEKIIWLWPLRMSEQTRVTEKTQKILQLKIKDSKQPK
jgi:tRNA(Ile)-lysidine synthase